MVRFLITKSVATLTVFLMFAAACVQQNEHSVRVYVTKTGNKYHTGECECLGKSKIPMKLSDAIAEGYQPCQKCHAKQLSPQKVPH